MCKKVIHTFSNFYASIFSMSVFILSDVNEGMKAKLTRIAKGLRQIDLAAAARVDTIDITRLEKGRYVLPTRRKRILAVLGMDNESD